MHMQWIPKEQRPRGKAQPLPHNEQSNEILTWPGSSAAPEQHQHLMPPISRPYPDDDIVLQPQVCILPVCKLEHNRQPCLGICI